MNLENSIKDVIQQKLTDGTIENIISEKLEKGISDAMSDLLRSYGDVGKVIKDKVSQVLIPAIESHDFSNHITKLDTILTDIVNSTVLVENKRLLENFKELMIEDETKKVIKVSELFEKWSDYVSEEIDTNGLEVVFDDSPSYEDVEITMTVEYEEGRGWSDFKKANIIFECEHDEKMNVLIPISNWERFDGGNWAVKFEQEPTINSLKHLNEFEVFLLKLKRMYTKIELDQEFYSEYIAPEAEPEAGFY